MVPTAAEWTWAAWGGAGMASWSMDKVWVELAGDTLETAAAAAAALASGHPHVAGRRWPLGRSGIEYSGRAVFAWVARQLRTVKGESMLISKCRRRLPAGSSGSSREMRITIWSSR